MLVMIAPNSLVGQREGAQGKEEEEAGDRRKGDQIETPMQGGVGCGKDWQ